MDDFVLYVASLEIGCAQEPPAVSLLSSQLKWWKLLFCHIIMATTCFPVSHAVLGPV